MASHLDIDLLLVGQPNVGKSVLFSRLTGVRTISSNYPGTTVSFDTGKSLYRGVEIAVADAPGTYSLEPDDEAARTTVGLIERGRCIVNVVDSTHLERHLPLTIELQAQGRPIVVALNLSDEAAHQGIEIDTETLSGELGAPVVAIVARTGQGVRALMDAALVILADRPRQDGPRQDVSRQEGNSQSPDSTRPHLPQGPHSESPAHEHLDGPSVWKRVGQIVARTQTMRHHHHTFRERLEEMSVHPVWGTLTAVIVVVASFGVIRLLGEFLIAGEIGLLGGPWVTLPFGTEIVFERFFRPGLEWLSRAIGPGSFVHRLVIGDLIGGRIDFEQSFGLLSSGLYIPMGVVLPYLFSFYLVLSVLEDSGYLPRLAVFLDSAMHRIGLHGYAIVPVLLSLGCNVPGIMATRILETRRQRFVTATLISIAIPCAALQAMIVGLVGARGVVPLLVVYCTLVAVWIAVSLVLRITSREFRPELLIEIPPYRLPSLRATASKMSMRIRGFLREALPIIAGAVLVVNLLYQFRVFDALLTIAQPVVMRLWGLPREAAVPLMLGVLRKDVAMGLLAPLAMTTKQLVTASVILSMFFPCLATLAVLIREIKLADSAKAMAIMLIVVVGVGAIMNLVLPAW